MSVERADADLHEPLCMSGFADPRERRGMATRISAEIIIEIGMGIEVKDCHRAMTGRRSLDERETHRMVAAQRQRHLAILVQHHDMAADRGVVLLRPFGQRQVAVIGLPDEYAGQKVHAVAVALQPDVAIAPVLQAVAGTLAAYMVPRDLELVESLPVTPNGKVDYRQLVRERTGNG